MRAGLAAAGLALALASPAGAAAVDPADFRYTRELRAPGAGAVLFEADGPLFAHTRDGFADLRVVAADGEQVPWRRPPEPEAGERQVEVLNRGRLGDAVVALLDLGPERQVIDRVELEVPDVQFVGRVEVFGSDDRAGPFARLGSTPVYDIAGAEGRARSTTVAFPPTDHRFLRLEATGVPGIAGAAVSARPRERAAQPVPARAERTEEGNRTRLVADLGHRKRPVDELRIRSAAERYDRTVIVEVSEEGTAWRRVALGRAVHFPGSTDAPLAVGDRGRYLRVWVLNGDDEPLPGLEAVPLAVPRLLLAEERHARPYRLLYGGPGVRAPQYDFAELPAEALTDEVVRGTLGPERPNDAFEPPGDTRSFVERHPALVQAALAVAALALGLGGFLALRRRT